MLARAGIVCRERRVVRLARRATPVREADVEHRARNLTITATARRISRVGDGRGGEAPDSFRRVLRDSAFAPREPRRPTPHRGVEIRRGSTNGTSRAAERSFRRHVTDGTDSRRPTNSRNGGDALHATARLLGFECRSFVSGATGAPRRVFDVTKELLEKRGGAIVYSDPRTALLETECSVYHTIEDVDAPFRRSPLAWKTRRARDHR